MWLLFIGMITPLIFTKDDNSQSDRCLWAVSASSEPTDLSFFTLIKPHHSYRNLSSTTVTQLFSFYGLIIIDFPPCLPLVSQKKKKNVFPVFVQTMHNLLVSAHFLVISFTALKNTFNLQCTSIVMNIFGHVFLNSHKLRSFSSHGNC